MRRKSERVVSKKSKASPDRSIETSKRPKNRRKKQSSSSENESCDESSPAQESGSASEVSENLEKNISEPPITKENLDEAKDQVWQVKTTEVSGDIGEIQKLKLCLTRPPSTPERSDNSPRSKGKLSRAASCSDTLSADSSEEKKKKHRSRKSSHDPKNERHDAQVEHPEEVLEISESSISKTTKDNQSAIEHSADAPVSTTSEEDAPNQTTNVDSNQSDEKTVSDAECKLDADTTVVSPKAASTVINQDDETITSNVELSTDATSISNTGKDSPTRKRSASVDKSEILELHPDDSSKIESSDNEIIKPQQEEGQDELSRVIHHRTEVSINQDQNISHQTEVESNKQIETINESGVVEQETVDKEMKDMSTDLKHENKVQSNDMPIGAPNQNIENIKPSELSDSTKHTEGQNDHTPSVAANRKRRWGSRPTKLMTQKSITISTDVLKEIIPDVKPVEFDEVIEEKKHHKIEITEKVERPILPKIVIDNTVNIEYKRKESEKEVKGKDIIKPKDSLGYNRKISIVKDNDSIISRPPSPPKNKQSCILYITNLVRPFTSLQLKNLLLRTGKIVDNGFWMDKIKSKCFVQYEKEEQAVETRHALHGVKWPVSNPKTLQVDFSSQEAFDKAKLNEDADNAQVSSIPGTVEDWLREQDMKKEKNEMDKSWERKTSMREWDVGKNEKDKDRDKIRRDERPAEKKRHRSIERSPEPARKFKKKEEAPAKLLDDLFRKTKVTPCIYWLPLSAETIAVKEEQRRQHMAEYERRMQEQRRTHRRH